MRISLLTSSRADYGIYLPLLKKMMKDNYFDVNIIAFGTHISNKHGYTIDNIIKDGFEIGYKLETVLGDSPEEIADSMALTMAKFSAVWKKEQKTDLIICLGDRYEMFAAVSSSIPFSIPIAHIHGGETTLGAIDNVFRHSLSVMSNYHFTSAEQHSTRVSEIIGNNKNIYNVGSLSLDTLDTFKPYSFQEFENLFGIDISKPTILVTFHPETVSFDRNLDYAEELVATFNAIDEYQIVITMPNADTMGNVIREKFQHFSSKNSNVIAVENFGLIGYFSAMYHCSFLLGNTSSGIIEAASFNKFVINLGDRQKGRTSGKNIFHIEIDKKDILSKIQEIANLGDYKGENIYRRENLASGQIIKVLKNI